MRRQMCVRDIESKDCWWWGYYIRIVGGGGYYIRFVGGGAII